MIRFADRREAGRHLASALRRWASDPHTVVIGLPRGGVPVADEVATLLSLPLDIIYPRKIGAPSNLEYAIGAITESGEGLIDDDAAAQTGATKLYIDQKIAEESAIARARLSQYREHQPKIPLRGKTVLIIDDGIATGATMKAAIVSARAEGAATIVVAAPVAPPDTVQELHEHADAVIVLAIPNNFRAVGQFYDEFGQTNDGEIVAILERRKHEQLELMEEPPREEEE